MAQLTRYEKGHPVQLDEYVRGFDWRAEGGDIARSAAKDKKESDEAEHRGQFTLRLMDPEGLAASDRFVQVVAVDNLGGEDQPGPWQVSVRPLTADKEVGRVESYSLNQNNVIEGISGDFSLSREGYFVGGEGVGADELLGHALIARGAPKGEPLQRLEAIPPFEQDRYYG